MNVATLLQEGQVLSKPSILLQSKDIGQLSAFWGGNGIFSNPYPAFEHLITFDCQVLPLTTSYSTGCIAVYRHPNAIGNDSVHVTHIPQSFPTSKGDWGTPLFSTRYQSLPPLSAVFRFGSQVVENWLEQYHWQRTAGDNGNFPDKIAVKTYNAHYFDQAVFEDPT